MACSECGELHTHKFHTSRYLRNAIAVALGEVRRGILREIPTESIVEQGPLEQLARSATLPDIVDYRFQCIHCGQLFDLTADTYMDTAVGRNERTEILTR